MLTSAAMSADAVIRDGIVSLNSNSQTEIIEEGKWQSIAVLWSACSLY